MNTLTLTHDQMNTIETLLYFHQDDEPNEFYPYQPYAELCEIFNVPGGVSQPVTFLPLA